MDRQFYLQKLENLKKIQKDDHHALRIAMCGKFKSGKSSLLNLMLNTNLPVRSITATGIVTKVIYGNTFAVKMKNGDIQNVSEEELYDYITVAEKNIDGVVLSDAEYAYIGSRSKLLKRGKVEFWDTPGLEDDPELTRITMNAIQQSDFVIYVMHANQVLSMYEKRIFPRLYKLMNGNIFFVVNHMDSLRPEEADSVCLTVGNALKKYANEYFLGENVFFTSANPESPEIYSLLNSIENLLSEKKKRIDLLNIAKTGKADAMINSWMEYISEDQNTVEKNINQCEIWIKNDIDRKKSQLERTYTFCEARMQRIQKKLETDMLDESAWRMVLLNYQNVPEWESNFVNGASALVKARMSKIVQEGNVEIRECVQETIFDTDFSPIVLDEEKIWRKAYWYKNFSRPLFFPERRFRQYCIDCVNKTISALMSEPVRLASETMQYYFDRSYSDMLCHYGQAYANVTADSELLQNLDDLTADQNLMNEYLAEISDIQEDINSAGVRNRFAYKWKEFFSFFFPGMLYDEIYGSGEMVSGRI